MADETFKDRHRRALAFVEEKTKTLVATEVALTKAMQDRDGAVRALAQAYWELKNLGDAMAAQLDPDAVAVVSRHHPPEELRGSPSGFEDHGY